MVARIGRRLGASLLAAVLVGCGPAPSASPSASPGPPASAAPTAVACVPVAVPGGSGPAETPPPWATRTWYEIFVRSFFDSDGDGIGDLAGATSKLEYLADLGIGGVWLMPVAESPSYHGYDVTDYTAVEPDYGDEGALKAFVAAAHERGILVIVDFVINHTSSDHPWFKDALEGGPHRDWYVWSETDLGWPAVAGPSPWHETDAGDYFYGAFSDRMPDLNLRNSDVTAEIDRIAGVWLDDFGVDGFRIDAARHLIEVDGAHQVNTPETLAWLADFSKTVHAGHPDALVLGEVWDVSKTAGGYVPDSADLTFDFGLASAMVSAIQGRRTPPITTALAETITSWPLNREASFLTNHDQNRVMSSLFGDVPAAHLAAFMLLTAPGVPFIYYGEEIGLQGRKPDEQIRTPMPWSGDGPAAGFSTGEPWEPLAEDWPTVNVAAAAADPASLLATYRRAIAFRMEHPALAEGGTLLVAGEGSVIGWLRAAAGETLLVVVNLDARAVSDYALRLEGGPLCGVAAATYVDGVGDATPTVAAPGINATGGFDAYRPIGTLQPRSGYLIQFTTP
jgi:alpha-amylase